MHDLKDMVIVGLVRARTGILIDKFKFEVKVYIIVTRDQHEEDVYESETVWNNLNSDFNVLSWGFRTIVMQAEWFKCD